MPSPLSGNIYDTIIYSDVIYYLNDLEKHTSLKWISDHLHKDGLAFIAAWCPGKQYLEYNELWRLVCKYFALEEEHQLESGHGVFLARKRKFFLAVTVNYETWNPIPPGKKINWENDIFIPAENLLKIFKRQGICFTLMPDMGEYIWLKKHNPSIAGKMD